MKNQTEQHNQTISQAEEAAYQMEETKNDVKYLVLASIISADNDKYTEEQKQEVITRYENRDKNNPDWKYILEPVDDTGKLAELFAL